MPLPVRSPYGIRNKSPLRVPVEPTRPNWVNVLLKMRKVLVPNADERTAARWSQESASGQLGGATRTGETYSRKIQREFTAGLRSQDIFPASATTSLAARMPWPVGRRTGPPASPTGLDYPTRGPQAVRTVYPPRADPYGQILTSQDRRYSGDAPADYVPVAGGAQNPQNLDYGAPPWRVPLMRRSGLSLQATPGSFGWPANQDGLAGRYIIAPPRWSDPTRGTRAASGIKGRVAGGASTTRVPAAFVPREVS